MKRFLLGLGMSLILTLPLWLPTIWALPWAWTADKHEYGMGVPLGLLFGSIFSILWAAIQGFGMVLETLEKGVRKHMMAYRLGLNTVTACLIFGATLLGGFWLSLSTSVMKTYITDPKELGAFLIYLPIGVLVYEFTRIFTRRTYLTEAQESQDLSEGQKQLWTGAAVLQSLLVLAVWIGSLMAILEAFHTLIPNADEVRFYHIWVLLLMLGLTVLGALSLRRIEGWLYSKLGLPWLSDYANWQTMKEWFKD